MGKMMTYLGGLIGIIGLTLMLLGHAGLGSPALAVAIVLFLSGWFSHFRRQPDEKPEPPKKMGSHRSGFDI